MWRTSSEAARPELSGEEAMNKQVPASRAVPLWGGIGSGGFGVVLFHENKKLTEKDWVAALRGGKLVAACKSARPDRSHGPWHIIADNESFLKARGSQSEYARLSVHLWHIPPRSPDLNPVEKFWAYLRRRLQQMDLRDLASRRPPVNKTALRARVRQIVSQKKSQNVAKNLVAGLMKTCKAVKKNKGAAVRG